MLRVTGGNNDSIEFKGNKLGVEVQGTAVGVKESPGKLYSLIQFNTNGSFGIILKINQDFVEVSTNTGRASIKTEFNVTKIYNAVVEALPAVGNISAGFGDPRDGQVVLAVLEKLNEYRNGIKVDAI